MSKSTQQTCEIHTLAQQLPLRKLHSNTVVTILEDLYYQKEFSSEEQIDRAINECFGVLRVTNTDVGETRNSVDHELFFRHPQMVADYIHYCNEVDVIEIRETPPATPPAKVDNTPPATDIDISLMQIADIRYNRAVADHYTAADHEVVASASIDQTLRQMNNLKKHHQDTHKIKENLA